MIKPIKTFFFFISILVAADSALGQNGTVRTSDAPVKFSADALEYRQNQNVVLLTGNVRVSQGEMTLMSDLIELHQTTDKSSVSDTSKLKAIRGFGNVVVETPNEKATGDNGAYDLKSETITLSGNVTLRQGGNILHGDHLDIDLGTGISRIHGAGTNSTERVKGVLNPRKLDE